MGSRYANGALGMGALGQRHSKPGNAPATGRGEHLQDATRQAAAVLLRPLCMHGPGSLQEWQASRRRPLISRLTSFREPIELKVGMVFAVETYCPATDGISAARIEEEVILTPTGPKVISLYPAQELPIANPY